MLFSTSFSDLGGASDGMSEITSVALSFVYVGAFAFAVATLQSGCLEIAAAQAATNFSQQWFSAILRQDTAFFDAHDVSGLASMIGASSRKVRRGLGRKFGEGDSQQREDFPRHQRARVGDVAWEQLRPDRAEEPFQSRKVQAKLVVGEHCLWLQQRLL